MKFTLTIEQSGVAIVAPRFKKELDVIFARSRERYNGYITVTIETPKKPRTTGEKSQNRHLNGHIQQIAQETGTPFDVVKHEIKQRAITRGYPILYDGKGKAVLDIFGREQGISEADCSTVECGYLIDETHQLAAELDFVLREE